MNWLTNAIAITPSAITGWQTVDLSAVGGGIPANAVCIIRWFPTTTVSMGARTTGSGDNRTQGATSQSIPIICGVDASSRIDLYKNDVNARYYLQGWFTSSEATYFSTGVNKTPAGTGWQDIDCSANVPIGTKFAIFEFSYAAPSVGQNFRKKGSGDLRQPTTTHQHLWYIIGLDINRACQVYLEASESNTIYLVGYVNVGISKETGLDKSISVTGSYQNIDLSDDAPSDALAVIVEVMGSNATNQYYGLRKDGSTDDWYPIANGLYYNSTSFDIVELPVSKIIEGKINNITVDFWIHGYISPLTIAPVANFTGSPLSGNVPLTVNFTDTSTGGIPTFWEWSYRLNGTSTWIVFSNSQNPTFIFTENGTYDIKLLTSNAYGYDDEIKFNYITVCNVGTVNVNLPFFDILSGSDGMILTLPMLTIGAGGMWTDFLKATMPMLNIQASGLVLSNDILANLPMFTISASGNVGIVGQLIASLPMLKIINAVDAISGIATLDLPIFTITATGSISITGTAILNLPMMQLISSAMTGEVGNLTESLPMLQITGAGIVYFNVTGEAYLVLPKLRINASGMVMEVDTYTVYAINLRNAGISKYTNYNFNQFTKFGNLYLASSSSGIYTLTGNDDDGSAINAKITTGKLSMGVDKLKRIVDFIFNLKAFGTPGANNYDVKMSTDDGVEYTYSLEDTNGIIHPVRVKTGKGKKGKFWTFKFLNKLGNDFELESIDIDVETTSRKT